MGLYIGHRSLNKPLRSNSVCFRRFAAEDCLSFAEKFSRKSATYALAFAEIENN